LFDLSVFAGLRAAVGTCAAAAALVTTSPALANSASADVVAPLRAAQEAQRPASGSGESQFRKLFADWQSLEKSQTPALASVAEAANLASASRVTQARGMTGTFGPRIGPGVSIPSRVPVEGRLTSEFGMREHPVLGGRRMHTGVDLASPVGTPVRATADGVVGKADWFGGYGLYVALEHGGAIETRYGHMSRLNVAAGQQVHKGDIIGFVGATGQATGPHLHYEVRVNGIPVNPLTYMQGDALAAR
jgi:murein DD-endopeptidase MepM/ murein hydrolase activator NlpD